jgi:predicted ferric reductase
MTRFLAAFLALVTLAWGWSALPAIDAAPLTLWTLRAQALTLTGLWSFALLSLAMVLATRPPWLERPFGGLDRLYRTHKRAGILAAGFAATHWLVELSDEPIKAIHGRAGRLPREHGGALFEALRDLGEAFGEWAIYALLAMLALTLWKRFPFHLWRQLHRAMPVLYLMLALHAAFLAPLDYWRQPAGALLALLLAAGTLASLHSLLGLVGRSRRVGATVEAVRRNGADLTEVVCRLDQAWRGHRPGQFAFVTFDRREGAHPFTIAGADRGDRRLTFAIKALGDYTAGLAARLRPGQPAVIEGPYGRFDFHRAAGGGAQVWIAAGVGATPFLAWLESLQPSPATAPEVDFYYCIRRRESDPFLTRMAALCATLPTIRLHVLCSADGERLSAELLHRRHGAQRRPELWYCGPQALADALRTGLRRLGGSRPRFHQECFEMR